MMGAVSRNKGCLCVKMSSSGCGVVNTQVCVFLLNSAWPFPG